MRGNEKQRIEIYRMFYTGIYTMKEVAKELEIDRANVCWAVGDFRTAQIIKLVKKGRCSITQHNSVGFYTTNPELFPIDNQTIIIFD